jgi:hypothetical protein
MKLIYVTVLLLAFTACSEKVENNPNELMSRDDQILDDVCECANNQEAKNSITWQTDCQEKINEFLFYSSQLEQTEAQKLTEVLKKKCPKFIELVNHSESTDDIDKTISELSSMEFDCSNYKDKLLYKHPMGKDEITFYVNDSLKIDYLNGDTVHICSVQWINDCEFETTLIEDREPEFPPYKGEKLIHKLIGGDGSSFVVEWQFDGTKIVRLIKEFK